MIRWTKKMEGERGRELFFCYADIPIGFFFLILFGSGKLFENKIRRIL